ncbi:MAG: hypothetical protein V8T10_10775 [Merdibacter sp.]
MNDISNFMGDAFEEICKEYVIRQAKQRKAAVYTFLYWEMVGNKSVS